jgi:DNA sulfur modification protein DndB
VDARFEYVFPSIGGVQSGHEYYVSMCPLRLTPTIVKFDEKELRPELRAQCVLNKAHIAEMARYIVANPKRYVFSAITTANKGG